MLRFLRSLGPWVFGGALVGAVAFGARFLNQDAFVGFKERPDAEVGIRLQDVAMTVYRGNEQVMTAEIEEVQVRRDRLWYDFLNVRGKSTQGVQRVDFESKRASYDSIARELRFDHGVYFENDDVALFSPKLLFNEASGRLTSDRVVAGRAMNGRIAVRGFDYQSQQGRMVTGPVRWNGTLPAVMAQEVSGAQGSPAQTPAQRIPWDIQFPGSEIETSGNIMRGSNLRATDGEILIRAEKGEYRKRTDVLIGTGKVYYFGEKVNLVADQVTVYRKEKRAVLTGNVRMLIKRKDQPNLSEEIPPFQPELPEGVSPTTVTSEEQQQQKDLDQALRSPENAREYPALVVAEKIELWYGKGDRRAIIAGNPQCHQDLPGKRWRRVFAFQAKWDGQAETLRLEQGGTPVAPVRLRTSIGDDLQADWFVISVREGQEEMGDWRSFNQRGKFFPDEDEIPPRESATGSTGSAGTPPPSG